MALCDISTDLTSITNPPKGPPLQCSPSLGSKTGSSPPLLVVSPICVGGPDLGLGTVLLVHFGLASTSSRVITDLLSTCIFWSLSGHSRSLWFQSLHHYQPVPGLTTLFHRPGDCVASTTPSIKGEEPVISALSFEMGAPGGYSHNLKNSQRAGYLVAYNFTFTFWYEQ